MTFPTFPTLIGLAWPVKRTPLWSTLKQPSISGLEPRFQLHSYPRWRYELAFDLLRSDANAELQTLASFYNAMNGAAQIFQFNDGFTPDNAVTGQSFGTGDGATTTFQLVRTQASFTEPVFKPTGTPAITDNGATVSPAAYTIGATGLVTFATAPAAGHALAWSGSYAWLCRFDDDHLEFDESMAKLWTLKKLSFTTVKL